MFLKATFVDFVIKSRNDISAGVRFKLTLQLRIPKAGMRPGRRKWSGAVSQ